MVDTYKIKLYDLFTFSYAAIWMTKNVPFFGAPRIWVTVWNTDELWLERGVLI